jgi:hypothetical protein
MDCKHEKLTYNTNFICDLCGEDIGYLLDIRYVDKDTSPCKFVLNTEDILCPVYNCADKDCYSFLYMSENYLDYQKCRWYTEIKKENLFLLEKTNNNYKITVSENKKHHFSTISDVITEFKKSHSFEGYFCFEIAGTESDCSWDLDLYLYIKSGEVFYRYKLNDSSCNYFNGEEFKKSETSLWKYSE